jgi:hypothetical protein
MTKENSGMLQLQKVYSEIQRVMRENKLPIELIDMIFSPVHKYNFKQMIRERDTTVKSIWWESSRRLRQLCGENGALQVGHYDTWTLFPSFILVARTLVNTGTTDYPDYDTTVKFFEEKSCGVNDGGPCGNCAYYGFPCRNKVCYCPNWGSSSTGGWDGDDYFMSKPNFDIEGLWEISDDPRVRDYQ